MSIALGPLGRNGEASGALNTNGKVAAMYVTRWLLAISLNTPLGTHTRKLEAFLAASLSKDPLSLNARTPTLLHTTHRLPHGCFSVVWSTPQNGLNRSSRHLKCARACPTAVLGLTITVPMGGSTRLTDWAAGECPQVLLAPHPSSVRRANQCFPLPSGAHRQIRGLTSAETLRRPTLG
jgi:hypothetical protein